MNLRELTSDQEEILKLVEDGEFTLDQVSDHVELLASERKNKIENLLHVINRLTNEEVTIAAEIDRLQSIRQQKEKALSRTKEWLLINMNDGEKHEFDLFKVSRVKGRDVCQITNDKKLPMKFMSHKPESWHPDKKEILKALKDGADVDGAEIISGKPSLRIK